MTLPRVSVLLPARDAGRTIAPALRSVLAQSLRAFELVVVDDGSTDDTAAIVRALGESDARIVLLRGPGEGIVGALNRGLARCRAPFVARFDADDLMHRERLAAQLALLEATPTLAGAGSLVRCFPRTAMKDGLRRYEAWQNALVTADDIRRERFVEAPVVHPSMTLRREALLALGGYREVPWPEDWDLWLRALEAGCRFEKVPRPLHLWRDGPARLTRTDARYSPGALVRARAHFLVRGPLRQRPAVLWGAGPVGKALAKALALEGARVVAYVEVDSRKIGQVVHGVPVVPAAALPVERQAVLLAAVGAAGAREEIRREAAARGYREGGDFFACA